MDRPSEASDIQNISSDDIVNVLKQLKIGKSAGADHIHAEQLIHASDRLTVLLSILCTSIMKHGHIPSGMLDTTLTPIVKTTILLGEHPPHHSKCCLMIITMK